MTPPTPNFDQLQKEAARVTPRGDASGVPLPSEDKPTVKVDDSPPPPTGEWGSKCQMRDQMTNPKYAGTWRELPMQVETYDLLRLEDKIALNDLMKETSPAESPSVKINQSQTYQFPDKLQVVVYFTRYEYRKVTQDT